MDVYNLFKKIAFRFDPEFVHEHSLNLLVKFPFVANFFERDQLATKYKINIAGCDWTFPVGLAAGLEKNALALDFFSRLPFGCLEVGTVTPKPQQGNDKPRLWRYPQELSLRNRMGFNNDGMEVIKERILNHKRTKPIGVNLGKNKITSNEKSHEDYQNLYKCFAEVADYMVINVSSPNTPGLRDLQDDKDLKKIFEALEEPRKKYSVPLFLKIAPDLTREQVISIVNLCHEQNLNGIIATNTTIIPEWGEGGCSGRVLKSKAREVRKWVCETSNNTDLEVIGVGGIESFEDILDFWKMGGKVVQVYSSFIFQGPAMLSNIRKEIDAFLNMKGISNLEELFRHKKDVLGNL